MRSPHLALGVFVLAASLFLRGTGHAQAAKQEASPYEFSIRTYPLPSWELENGFETKDKGRLSAPKMPSPGASTAEQEAFLKKSHEVVKEYLLTQEMPLPPGSLACYDPGNDAFSLRATDEVHEMIEPLFNAYINSLPKHLSWRLEIVEAESADVRAAVKQCQGRTEHGSVLSQLTAKGAIITTMHGEAKGGKVSTVHQGGGFNSPKGYVIPDANSPVQPDNEYLRSGVLLELDPVIGEGNSISLNCRLQYWPTPPKARLAQITAGSAPKVEVEWLDLPAFTTKFGSTIQDGGTRLLGTWDLDTLADPTKAGRSQAAFLCTHIVRVLSRPDPNLERMLRERGEAVSAALQEPPLKVDSNEFAWMEIRRFMVPSDFETMSSPADDEPSVDPFSTAATSTDTPRPVRHTAAQKILERQGIPFPPGTFARFLRGANEVVVRNLPHNLELVEQFMNSILYHPPLMAQTTVEIIEADAALLRRLARETGSIADHSTALETLEAEINTGKARVFRSAWIETLGGQDATWQNVVLTKTVSEVGFRSGTQSETNSEEDGAKAQETSRGSGNAELYVHSEEMPIGFAIDLSPMIGEDDFIDLDLTVRADTAPMSTLPAASPAPPDTQRAAFVNMAQYGMDMKTSITLKRGIPRLLTLYQPTTAEGPVANVLHAVFVCTDVINPDRPDE